MTAYTFDQLITFTRTSAATYVGSNGLVAVTPASRNLLTYTQEFANAAWTKTRSSITANSTAAPNGINTADTLNEDSTAASTHPVSVAVTLAAAAHTLSIYVKASGRSWVQISLLSTANAFANFNVSTGALGTVGSAATATITSVGNGWYRCTMTATTGAGANTVAIYPASADNTVSFTGTGIASLFIWGAQLEAASAASTYTRNNGGVYPPRLDYDPVTRAPRGLLIEEQRTNLLTYSEQFDNAAWTKDRVNVSANATTAPDGAATADKITDTAAGPNSYRIYNSLTLSAISYTQTFYAKAAEYSWCYVRVGTSARAWFNLANGTVGNVDSGLSASISDAGNGWYRISCTIATATAGAGFGLIGLTTGNGVEGYTPTTGGMGIFVWGAQLEAGAFATSYIPTVASQVTRTADQAAITAPMFAPWYRQSEGTFVVQAVTSKPASVGASGLAVDVSDGGINNRHYIGVISASAGARTVVGGVDQASIAQAYTANAIEKYGYAVKENDFAFYRNGSQAGLDTTGSMPTVNRMFIGNAAGSAAFWNGHIQSIDYYPTRLTNAQIQALTA